MALDRGWLGLWTLELDDRPVAVWYGIRFAGVDTYSQSARDPGLERASIGLVLLAHSIREARPHDRGSIPEVTGGLTTLLSRALPSGPPPRASAPPGG